MTEPKHNPDSLCDRLRGNYAIGPHLPNGKPEFGWRQFEAPPIQHEAADRIEEQEAALTTLENALNEIADCGRYTRAGGATPEDLDDYETGLTEAIQIAIAALNFRSSSSTSEAGESCRDD